MRVLHLSDVHLDTPYASRSKQLRMRLQNSARDAFEAAIERAIDDGWAAVLVAGDLFDSDTLSFATERRLIAACERLGQGGIPLLYAHGNHDPADMRRALPWPDNVTCFATEKPHTVTVDTPAGPLRVTGAGHQSARCGTNLAALFPTVEPVSGCPHIALLHAQLKTAVDADRHDRYAPATREDLEGKGYDYWALGHVHERQQVLANPPAWYSGIIQGRTPKEAGQRGANLVTFDAGRPAEVEFIPLGPLVWQTIVCDGLETANNYQEIAQDLTQRCAFTLFEAAPADTLMRLQLVGRSPLFRELKDGDNCVTLAEELQSQFGFLDVEIDTAGLRLDVDVAELEKRTDVLGEALRLLTAARSDEELLRTLAPETLASTTDAAPTAWAHLLDGAETDLIEALLQGDGQR